jgi:RND family efflux transporter MFP subunit
MEGKSKLLDELVIDRGRPDSPRRSHWPLLVAIGVGVLALGGAWLWWKSSSGSSVAAASAGVSSAAAATSAARSSDRVPTSASQLDASGYVVARRKATVSSPLGGRVMEVRISEGMRVKAGDVLARLDDAPNRLQLAQAQAQLTSVQAQERAAQTAFDNAAPIYQRMQRQSNAGFLSAQDLDVAKTTYDNARSNLEVQREAIKVAQSQVAIAQRNLSDTVIRAPFAGIVTEKNAQPGEIISPGAAGGSIRTGIGTVVDMESLEVEIDVSENFIQRVHAEQPVTITLNAYPESGIPGKVIALIPTADRAKATVKVRVGFLRRDERILPDMGARVAFLADQSRSPPAAP